MTHLIKLELKKFGIAQNIIFMFAAILFSILFITISLWDSMTDPKQVKDTFESTYLVIGLLMSFIFLVYSSVLTAKLVIGEYNHRTITIMFSYPLNRIKLIASKLTIIMVYTAISMTIGYICCSSYIIFADKSFNMLEGTFQPSMLRTWIPMAITTVIICMAVSVVIYYWHDQKICSCNNRYFFDCYCVTASYYHQKHNQSGVHNASYLSCYCYRHCYTTYL